MIIDMKILDRMVSHARKAAPLECCGLLAGRKDHTTMIRPMTNEAASRTAFFVPPKELFDFFRWLRTSDLELTGIYHSHPSSPPVPSEKDERDFHYRQVAYWIVSLADRDPDVRCYRWSKMGFEEIEFEVFW
jgi:[CysO sulfur-carrier protein]-S-L-cysteine hydrolase